MNAVISYLVQMILPAMAGALLWGVSRPLRAYFLERKGLCPGPCREGALLILFMFLAGLLALTLTPAGFWRELMKGKAPDWPQPFQGDVNLVPLRESRALLRYYIRSGLWTAILINFPGNIIMFFPVGFFAGLLLDKPRWWKSALLTLFLSAFIECFQLFISRGTDVDDVILNTLGGLLGHGAFLLLRRADPGFVGRCAKVRKGSA